MLGRGLPEAASKPVGNPIGPETQKHVEYLDADKDHPSGNDGGADAHLEAQAAFSISWLQRRVHTSLLIHAPCSPSNTEFSGEAPSWPCLVRCNSLFGSASRHLVLQPHPAGTRIQAVPDKSQRCPCAPFRKEWHATPEKHRYDGDLERVDETQVE